MNKPLRLLLAEESDEDAELLLVELRRGGLNPDFVRVSSANAFAEALDQGPWDLVICDHLMPSFNSFAALKIARDQGNDVPFIVVSGTAGEELAVEVMKAGANDYLMKGNLIRLIPAIERELRQASSRSGRQKAEDRLRQAQKMEAVGQLTGGIAHDFNNLLGVIIGNADLLSSEIGGEHKYLQEITRAAERGAELTTRLLAFSRPQPLQPRALDLGRIASGMQNMLRRSLGGSIEIEIIRENNSWPVSADAAMLENAILNLAINARDAMAGTGTLRIETHNIVLDKQAVERLKEIAPGEYGALSVTNTGTGMPPEIMDRAFEPFFTTKEVGTGTGLGLSMVYGFVRKSGGTVGIESSDVKGTTVTLYLPRLKERAASQEKTSAEYKPLGKGETIFVVEDEANVRQLIATMLENLGYKVTVAPDAQSALAVLRENAPVDLLLTNVILPGQIKGTELAREARKLRPGLNIIFMSGYTDTEISDWMDEGVEFMHKPFRSFELAQRVRAALDSGAEQNNRP